MSAYYDHGGEGDTPAFLYLISAALGLNDPLDPTQGSWGSMFQSMGEQFPDGYFHTCGLERSELERWIPAAKTSFLNRLQYSTKGPEEVNHEPVALINGAGGNQIIRIKEEPGARVILDASGSNDPDGDEINFNWFYYQEASSYKGQFSLNEPNKKKQELELPRDIGNSEIHLILEVRDNGAHELVSYRRIILSKK
jgi:hypothetical protein